MWDRAKRHDTREALFGGRRAVRVWDLLGARPLAPFAAALACELEPGGAVGAHVQEHFPEVVLVVEGAGRAWVSGVERALSPGSAVSLPLGETLAIENGSDDAPLRYLIVKAALSAG